MTALAPYISSFLREHLPKERRASLHTCEAYAHSFRLLVGFAASRLDVRPCRLEIEQLDVPLILAFLEDIEANRGNSATQCSARRYQCLLPLPGVPPAGVSRSGESDPCDPDEED